MARRRKTPTDAFLNEMLSLPWWASVAAGALCWIGVWLVLAWFPDKHPIQVFRTLWWVIPGIFGTTAAGSLVMAGRARISLGHSKTLRELQAVPWAQFETLVAAYYRTRGFSVVHTGKAGPDGGFDLVMRKDGERILAQCKKYVRDSVGVSLLREFFGVVVSEGAHRGIFITTSDFTPDAREFGLRHANLELIPGRRFAEMVQLLHAPGDISSCQGEAFTAGSDLEEAVPCCPKCGGEMTNRTAKSGRSPGEIFWGCHSFPTCRGTRPVVRAMAVRQ